MLLGASGGDGRTVGDDHGAYVENLDTALPHVTGAEAPFPVSPARIKVRRTLNEPTSVATQLIQDLSAQ